MAGAPLEIVIPLGSEFVRVLTGFVEEGSRTQGLGDKEALKITLAAEEVFAYLAQLPEAHQSIRVRLQGGGYYVKAEFIFPQQDIDLHYFNLTAKFTHGGESPLEQLGLLIASRSVERFNLREQSDAQFSLELIKEKAYPSPSAEKPLAMESLTSFRMVVAAPEQVKLLALLISQHYPPHNYPSSFAIPGKLADMVAGGEYQAMVALGEREQIGGAMLWRHGEQGDMRAYGPYLFGQPQDSNMAAALVEACLERVAKTPALSLICRYATNELPREYFELLGDLDHRRPDGSCAPWHHYYRQLQEDQGLSVWCHPLLAGFLGQQYQRLFLARDLHLMEHEGERRPAHSVFGAHFDRSQGHVTLKCVLDGRDAGDNLARHVALLTEEGLTNVFFTLDLGLAWQAYLVPDLQGQGFEPKLVLPHAGQADLLVLQLVGQAR